MRLASLFLVLALMLGCEEAPPAFPVPAGPPIPIALDVQFPVYTLGTWLVRSFSESLAIELAKYNIHVVDRRAAPKAVAVINLGLWGYRQVIDTYLARGGEITFAGRVHVPDLSETTLEVAAQFVAPVIARSAWDLGEGAPEK